ncbi:MAG: Gx transporter family protein [Nitrospirae bacterium]|nr:Gx transporter family protein [Nitrospirota bacterium]
MQSQDKYRLSLLGAMAIALHVMERLIPSPIPWLRLGLANIITLVALFLYGFRGAFTITLIRVLAGSLLTGTFLGPPFALSLAGGILSVSAMSVARRIFRGIFGPLGLSLIGALFHNLAQILVAYLLFIHNFRSLAVITPFILFLGTITGTINGIAAVFLLDGLQKSLDNMQNNQSEESQDNGLHNIKVR